MTSLIRLVKVQCQYAKRKVIKVYYNLLYNKFFRTPYKLLPSQQALVTYYAIVLLTFKLCRHELTINPLAKYTAPSAVILLFLKTHKNIHHCTGKVV